MQAMDPVRVRFAPSPTGYLHVGGARTALFNWLYARHHKGTFILRIEDTDRTRSTDQAIEQIFASLRWLGLDWDEVYRQTDRFARHREVAAELVRQGAAYESEGALWFRVPTDGATTVPDLLAGDVTVEHRELKDLVILRSDATPTYNFACVVDDHDMGITHVIRGAEHLNNTPKQLLIYEALGWSPPAFAHVPLILGPDRTKLSKRHGAGSVLDYDERGILPEALVNFLARLGWSHGDQEVFSRDELVALFDLPGVNTAAAVFDEEKLLWLNHEWLRRLDPYRLADLLAERIVARGVADRAAVEAVGRDKLARAAVLLRERGKTLVEMADRARPYLPGAIDLPDDAQDLFVPEVASALRKLATRVEGLADPTAHGFEAVLRGTADAAGLPMKALAPAVRVAVTGSRVGPGLFELLAVVGKEIVAARLRDAAAEAERRRG
ncbi:MAG: glutamate--tRNA ligase [Candidatus Bipolaricaulota bacterium]